METNSTKNTAALIHLSTLTQYLIPFGNYIFPIIIWSATKDKSTFIDQQGKRAINFQLSLFLYSLVLCLIAFPVLFVTVFKNVSMSSIFHGEDWILEDFSLANVTGIVAVAIIAAGFFFLLKVVEFFLVIYASVQSSNGEDFKYPLTIPFLK
ncbi:DUF4870 domain-containing protein [Flavobacterium caeni]|uniref:DUF4870 domain-containing protein n=1 Tax=Flavobacterium caeni TaxID=490189 RepID=A0A1G5AII4_9FLAO|nr:DUF4870 domain-containing protein [Flavobacterium caeni]SCX77650.1 hypothetical protein SAMN02927903_00010 [Flavobacterium caeni]